MKNIIVLFLFLFSLSLTAQVQIGADGGIHPSGNYPVTNTSEIKGTPKNVADLTARDAIAFNLRETGMLAYVAADNTIYQLQGGTTNINWTVYSAGGGVGVDTLASYAQLRGYTGNSKTLFITDFTKTSSFDGLTYTTKGGLFYQVTAGTENGCTLIVATNGKKWARAYLGRAINYQWFEINGYTTNGTLTGNHLTTNIGIWNDADRLQYAVTLSGNYTEIDLEGNTVIVDHKITFSDYQKIKNGTIKRVTSPSTTLTASFGSAATTLTVASSTGFRNGQLLLITNPSATNGGYGFDENQGITSACSITSISGTSITITQATGRTMASGNKVSLNTPMIAFDGKSISFENVIFDGNGSMTNGGTNAETRDWRLQLTGTLTATKGALFTKCTFINIPSSNIQGGKVQYSKCYFKRTAGSIYHESIANRYTPETRISSAEYCEGDSLGVFSNIANHEESLFTRSANTDNLKIIGNRFTNTFYTSGICSANASEMGDIQIEDNYIEAIGSGATARYLILGTLSGVDSNVVRVKIKNNTLVNMGDISLNGNDITRGYAYSGLDISNNIFVNTRAYFLNCANSKINDNYFLTDTINGWTGWSAATSAQNAYIQFQACTGMEFKRNKVYARSTYDLITWAGLSINTLASMTQDGVYYYNANMDIDNNLFYGFGAGITAVGYGSSINACTICYRSVSNWNIINNVIVSATGSLFQGHGILAPPGAVVTGNTIYWRSTTSGESPIFAYGVNDTTANLSKIVGSIIKNNTVYSAGNRSITIGASGSGSAATTGSYHIVCTNNIVNKAVTRNYSGSNSLDTMNITLGSVFTGYSAPQIPNYKVFKPKKGLIDL